MIDLSGVDGEVGRRVLTQKSLGNDRQFEILLSMLDVKDQ